MVNQPAKTIDIRNIFKNNASTSAKERDNVVIDSEWISSRYMVSDDDLSHIKGLVELRHSSNASLKYTDTSIGGNIFINPKPQFNALTDPKADNYVMGYANPTLNSGAGNKQTVPGHANLDPQSRRTGMGEGYSQLIDDNQQTVFLEFGLPKFNSLIDFFFRATDYNDSVLANTGRPAAPYIVGKGIGFAIVLVAFPILTIVTTAIKFVASLMMGDTSLRFYYMQPHMHMYWGTVNTLVTQFVTEKGLLAPVVMNTGTTVASVATAAGNALGKATGVTSSSVGTPIKLAAGDIENLNKIIPGIIDPKTNYVDVFRIITRAQRAQNVKRGVLYRMAANGELNPDKNGTIAYDLAPPPGVWKKLNAFLTFGTYAKEATGIDTTAGDTKIIDPSKGVPADNNAGTKNARDPHTQVYTYSTSAAERKSMTDLANSFDAAARNGASYAIFGVEYTGGHTETFTNSVGRINIGDKAKALSMKSRELTFNLARGNLFGSSVADAVAAVGDVAKSILNEATFGIGNVLAAVSGNAYVELPKRWEDSTMNFQQHTYTMSLVSPYNSFLSQLQNIYVPLFMVLAGVLPQATGKSSYTSPYLCSLFSKGLEHIKLGMITSVSIKSGITNLGIDKRRNPLSMEVSFTVTDFSTMVTSPVNSSLFTGMFQANIEDDTPLGNYISTLAGRDVMTTKYRARQVGIRLSRKIMTFEKSFNMDSVGVFFGTKIANSFVGNVLASRSFGGLMGN